MNVESLSALGRWAVVALAAAGTVPNTPDRAAATRQRREQPGATRFDKPGEARAFHARKRAPIGETAVPTERYAAALKLMRQMPVYSSAERAFRPGLGAWDSRAGGPQLPNVGTWSYLGPGNIGGRTRAILFDPSFASNDTLYAGGVAGGVWKSTDAGASWNPIADVLSNLAVSSMAMSPTDPDTIYVGTGEGYYNIDSVRGDGLFKTTDGGGSWSRVTASGNASFYYVNKLAVSGANPANLYAATGTGLWRSTDSGSTWTRILNPGVTPGTSAVSGGCMDVVVRDDVAQDSVVVSCGTFSQSYVYRNPTAATGGSWTEVLTAPALGRTSLAIAPTDQAYVYALAANKAFPGVVQGVYRSTDGGATFAARNTYAGTGDAADVGDLLLSGTFAACPGLGPNYFSQGWYDQFISVDPTNRDRLFAAGVQVFRSDDGGINWGSTEAFYSATIHPDNHVIAFPPDYDGITNKNAYVGNDGGIYRMNDTTATPTTSLTSLCDESDPGNTFSFTGLNNGYGVTQYYYGAVYPSGDTYFGGTQDNGTSRGTDAGGPNGWTMIHGGDGGAVAVDPSNTNVLYAEYTGASIEKCTSGLACTASSGWSDATSGISDGGFQFIAPFTMDPSQSQRLWTGGFFIWRTVDAAANWSQASTALSGSVSSVAVDPSNGNHVLVGSDSGMIYRSTTALSAGPSTVWASVTPVVNGYVSSVGFDPSNGNVAFATYSTFGVTHVWKSTNGGAAWSPSAASLPDVPAWSVVVDASDSSKIYLGTDVGVFVSVNGGANWAVENTGFVNAVTEHLVANAGNLYAFTHGRGVWRVSTAGVLPDMSVADVSVNEPNTGTVNAAFVVSMNGPAPSPVSVQYATSPGTAAASLDYTTTSGSLTFAPGTTTRTVIVPVKGDTLIEGVEDFTLGLSNAVGANLVDDTAVGTINDNDTAGTFVFGAANYTVSEAAAFATITVKRTGGTAGPVSVGYTTSPGTATAPGDYTTADGSLTFNNGILSQTFKVFITPDTVHESSEALVVNLQSPGPTAILGTPSTAVLTITDNDAAPAIAFAAAAYSVNEAGPNASLIVKRTGSLTGVSTVDYLTSNGTAASGTDYTLTSGSLTYGSGVAAQTITVPVTNDPDPEANETFKVTLSNPGNAVLGTLKASTVSILNNDQGLVFSAAAYVVQETMPAALITVKRTGGTAGTLIVNYDASGGTAVPGTDYTPVNANLTFAPGMATKTFSVPILNDVLNDGSQSVNLTLTAVDPLSTVGSPGTAVLTINDNEPVFQFGAATYTIGEIGPKATITVKRTGPTTGAASASYEISGGTATSGPDYSISGGTVSFAPGKASNTFAVNIVNDTVDEPNETVRISLVGGTLPSGYPSTTTLTITDNDVAGKVQFSAATYAALETAGNATVTLTRSGGTSRDATVNVVLSDGSAVAGTHYTNVGPVLVTFAQNQTSQTFQVPVLSNGADGLSRYLIMALDSPGGGLTLGPLTSANLWVADTANP